MADFTAKDVQALRQATGAGMLDAKRALEAANGDFEAARKVLREQGVAGAAKRSERVASQGAVAKAITAEAAALVELRCETDFVAKAPEFVSLAEELAELVAAKGRGGRVRTRGCRRRTPPDAQGEHLGRPGGAD